MTGSGDGAPVVRLEAVGLDLPGSDGRVRILSDVSIGVAPGEAVALVGESGAGKSMALRCIVSVLPDGAHRSGRIVWEDGSTEQLRGRALARFRATHVGMIFQDPRSSINPLRTVGDYLLAGLAAAGVEKAQARSRVLELLERVGIPDGERRMRQYPQELSGGLLQRVSIVGAMATRPRLLLADEPTTNLDVRTQADVLLLIEELRSSESSALLIVTHDLDLAAAVADRVAIMYAGTIVETGSSHTVMSHPQHPYTAALLAARPRIDRRERIAVIPGRPAAAYETVSGCAFAPRCKYATDRCRSQTPTLRVANDGASVACHRTEEIALELARDES